MIVTAAKAKSSSISAVITRADGSVENLGMIAYWHRNPIIRFVGNIFIKINGWFR